MATSDKELIALIKSRISRPMLIRELMRQLRMKPDRKRELKRILDDLVARGEIVKIRGNRFGLAEKMDLETGRFQAHPAGYGFVIPEKKGRPDVYIAARSRLDAMDGDTVLVRISSAPERKKAPGKREGVIVRILARAHRKIVGTFELSPARAGIYGFVAPSNPRIAHDVIIGREHAGGAKNGDIVSAELVSYPLHGRPPEGRITRILGKPGQPGIEVEIVIEEHELPVDFHPAALKEAAAIPQEVRPSMRRGRRDLRDLPTVTIDGETAKDFDDALSIEKIPAGCRLWVHIADVAHYVKEGSYIDQEAYRRGTSVYLPDRAIPMLPPSLSNGICSLNPGVDRLTLTAEMDFTPQGALSRYDLYESVIRSDERMTYTAVKEILVDRNAAQRKRYAAFLPQFELMDELMEVLRKRRMKRGSIDFDLPEPQIVLDLQGRISDILRAARNRAHMIVEEFMLAANETVAAHMEEREIPCVYRIHEEPKEDAVLALQEFLSSVGITLAAGKKLKPLHLQRAVEHAKGTPLEAAVNSVILRAMKQARYATENSGHFGLAAETYTHFTSPIRRYPDLMVHRITKQSIVGKAVRISEASDETMEFLGGAAAHSSQRERIAMEAERDVVTMLKLQFMADRIGESHGGVITGVTAFGFFVQLNELFVEGLVHVSSLTDDYYHYIEKQHSMRGERNKKAYRIGDRVTVRVDRVDRERKRIDFSLAK